MGIGQASRLQFAVHSISEETPHRTEWWGQLAERFPSMYTIFTANFSVTGPDHEVKAFLQQIQAYYEGNRLSNWSCSLNLSRVGASADVKFSVLRDHNDNNTALLMLQRAALPAPKEN